MRARAQRSSACQRILGIDVAASVSFARAAARANSAAIEINLTPLRAIYNPMHLRCDGGGKSKNFRYIDILGKSN
jgi:hypothetical protein